MWEGGGVIIIDKEGSCQCCCSFLAKDAVTFLEDSCKFSTYLSVFIYILFTCMRVCCCMFMCVRVCVNIIGGLSSTLGVILQVISTLVLHFMQFIIIV